MREKELNAHVAALLIAARHVLEAYGHASVHEQEEAIARLRRVVKAVKRQVATSPQIVRPRVEAGPVPNDERDPSKKGVGYSAGRHRIQTGRGRVPKRSANPRL
jgi:hypothetical protein